MHWKPLQRQQTALWGVYQGAKGSRHPHKSWLWQILQDMVESSLAQSLNKIYVCKCSCSLMKEVQQNQGKVWPLSEKRRGQVHGSS